LLLKRLSIAILHTNVLIFWADSSLGLDTLALLISSLAIKGFDPQHLCHAFRMVQVVVVSEGIQSGHCCSNKG
jgi:hypothetical protein